MKVPNWLTSLLLLEGVLLSSVSGKYVNTACQADSDCGLDTHLQCIGNYCQCDSHTQIYDQTTGKCLLLIGQECQSPTYTVTSTSNGQYYPSPSSDNKNSQLKCVPHADCTKSVCRCKPGYRPTLDLLCKPDYGSPCYAKDDCDETLGLVCTGRCDCFNNTWTYQGQFGCVDPKDPTYNEMLRLLNQTHYLLKENKLEIRDMFNELGLQNSPNSIYSIADERQFNQNNNNQNGGNGGGFNLQQLLSLFQTLQSFIPRNNNNNNNGGGNNGGGNNNGGSPALGFLRTLTNIFRPPQNNNNNGPGPGGYSSGSAPPPSNGYGAPGQPEGMSQRMSLINSFLNLFNQLIPVVRQLKMRFSPWRFLQNLISRLAPQQQQSQNNEGPPPPAPAIQHPPPNVVQSNGQYGSNPIFSNNNPNPGNQGTQGQGTFRFFMRSRDRFRNLLRGNNNQGQNPQGGNGNGGYDYSPSTNYGVPAGGAPPQGQGQGQGGGEDGPPPSWGEASAGSSNNVYSSNTTPNSNQNRPPTPPGAYRIQEEEYNTITIGIKGSGSGSPPPTSPKAQASQRHENQNQNNFGGPGQLRPQPPQSPPPQQQQSSYLPQNHPSPNHQSFFGGQGQSQNQGQGGPQPQQPYPQNNYNSNNNYNAQATSHHQSTFVLHPDSQPTPYQRPPPPDQPPSIYNSNQFQPENGNRPPSVLSLASASTQPPPPIPQFKLPVPKQKTIASAIHENYILSEADDPHPGFTPISTVAPSAAQLDDEDVDDYRPQARPQIEHQQSFRTSARFERIGEEDREQSRSAAENWRESF